MIGTDCPFSSKECNYACALFNQNYQGCNINLIAERLDNVCEKIEGTQEQLNNIDTQLIDIHGVLNLIDINTSN